MGEYKKDWGPGYRFFECNICKHKWKETSRDCTSPSSSVCPNSFKHEFYMVSSVPPYDYEPHYEWPTDRGGNLLKGFDYDNYTTPEIEEEWESTWKDILIKEEGNVDIKQLKKELFDFSDLIDRMTKLTCYMTNNMLSYPTYPVETITGIFEDNQMDMRRKYDKTIELLLKHCGWYDETIQFEDEELRELLIHHGYADEEDFDDGND